MRFVFSLRRLFYSYSNLYSNQNNAFNNIISRSYSKDLKLKWIRPLDVPSYDASVTGDLTPFQMPRDDEIREGFKSCELIRNATNENVKKLFMLESHSLRHKLDSYRMSLVNKVKEHEFDCFSTEVLIAKLTARIRILQYFIRVRKRNRKFRNPLNLLIHRRKKLLRRLRKRDYKKFEWLLEQLDLKYYHRPVKMERMERKKSIKLLANYRMSKEKELKLGEYKKKLDQQKVPFLEKKLKLLKEIKEQESAFQLQPTVTDSDIENCIKQIENVKKQVMENQRKGYVRKVHPYTLEVYYPEKITSE